MILIQIPQNEKERYIEHGIAQILLGAKTSGVEYQIGTRVLYNIHAPNIEKPGFIWVNGAGVDAMKLIIAALDIQERKKNCITLETGRTLEHLVIKIPRIQNFDLAKNIQLFYERPKLSKSN